MTSSGGLRGYFVRSENARGFSLLAPTLILLVLMMVIPIIMLVARSFWTQSGMIETADFSLVNYQMFFEKKIYLYVLGKSLLISGSVTFATLILAYPAAYFVAFRVKKNKLIWLILITVPFWTSYLLRVFAWKLMLGYNGVVNSGLIGIGIIDEPLGFLLHNVNAVVLTLAHAWAAFAILPIYVSLEKIDKSLLEAAADLGEGPIRSFLRVTLPLSMPGVIAASLLVFIPTVGDYVTPKLVGGSSGIMIGNLVTNMFGRGNNWPMGSAIAVMMMISITLVVCIYLWLISQVKKRSN
ncbi:MAG: ABC transporter permease [Rhodospirillales bacterium]|jgi:spermidine/putrescine transport system permease protein|nr:ABC transporter permease [Rhodospirillales bacterium]MBT4041422.1 ABC transporter permease [Rhodospirillales bacterium]MBT4628281.1 ABC transporter permease [Rhodospirillales bacterium]MBT5352295.1 ABC transporter permease [Rhodospirillales bacterium]MBT5521056.1 ABC transporter permease [Rhodospirillales bacterium]